MSTGRRLRERLGLVLGLASLGDVVWLMARNSRALPLTWAAWVALGPWLLAALVLATLSRLGSALVWRHLLATLGRSLPWPAALRIYTQAGLARYLPGGVWHVANFSLALDRHGVSRTTTLLGLWLETTITLIAGVAVALALGRGPLAAHPAMTATLAGLAGLAAIFSAPRVLLAALARLGRPRPAPSQAPWSIATLVRLLPPAMGLRLASGLVVYLLWLGLGGAAATSLGFGTLLGLEALSWALGFVVFVVPGGLGIRDSALVALLGPAVVCAPVLALLSRLVLLGGELMALLLVTPLALRNAGVAPAPQPGG